MWKSYSRDWQENAGYEDRNQCCESQGKNEKPNKNGPVKLINTRFGENKASIVRQ